MITINTSVIHLNSNPPTLLHAKNFILSPRSSARNGFLIELRKSFSPHFHQLGGQALTLRRNPNIPYENAKYAKVSMSPTATPSPFPLAQKRHPAQFKYLSALKTYQHHNSLVQNCSVKPIQFVKHIFRSLYNK